jgi:hypothetical protein
MSGRAAGILILAAAAAGGCTARQLGRDGNNFRVAVCDLYTEQAMDNLIRAKTNQPFVQLVYRDLLAQTTDLASGMAMGSTELARQTGPVEGIMRTVTSAFSVTGSASRERQLSFHADPVLDRPEVYETFLAFAHDPGLFVESDEPPACPVHIHRRRYKKHYWVPSEAGPLFQALVLRTSFQPPPEAATSPAYDVEVEQVVRFREVDPKGQAGRKGLFTVLLKLKTLVPNGDGTLLLELAGGRRLRAEALKYLGGGEGEPQGTQLGASTEHILIQYRPADDGVEPPQLQGLTGRFFSFQWPKVIPPTQPTPLQKLQADVDRIRANTRPLPFVR